MVAPKQEHKKMIVFHPLLAHLRHMNPTVYISFTRSFIHTILSIPMSIFLSPGLLSIRSLVSQWPSLPQPCGVYYSACLAMLSSLVLNVCQNHFHFFSIATVQYVITTIISKQIITTLRHEISRCIRVNATQSAGFS